MHSKNVIRALKSFNLKTLYENEDCMILIPPLGHHALWHHIKEKNHECNEVCEQNWFHMIISFKSKKMN